MFEQYVSISFFPNDNLIVEPEKLSFWQSSDFFFSIGYYEGLAKLKFDDTKFLLVGV
jgi:hypothetical protein